MGRIYRRSPNGPWWGEWTDTRGRRQRRSLRTADRAVARERLRAAELAATPGARRRSQRLSEAIDYMIKATCHDKAAGTRSMYEEKGRRIATTLGDPDIADVTRDLVSEYIKRRLSDEKGHGGAAAHTVQKELITIRRALREACDRGLLAAMPPMPKFSAKYAPKEVWLEVAEFEAMAAELQPERRLWAALAALGGMRSGEVQRLTWGMVGEERIRVPGTKTATARRTIPIAPALAARLAAARPDKVPPGQLVVAPWGNVRRDLHRACDRAKVKRVSPNDLRRTFASWLVQAGAPLLTVATLLGHSSTRMVERVYGRLSEANLDAAMALLPGTKAG